ncbi:hypothetical protein FSW04_06845 [Baekduia soli]|uniref:Phosphodiester glycosidase domain-containing protein n=1 Tax=Baekduia soli TaxID=496014 RepID=A0A5B8U326_9ACTN|nr:hypothetical protein [Baekduia soli]QEC47331.1 hypothetical protein FSW04_06845 [Baekduia soli]
MVVPHPARGRFALLAILCALLGATALLAGVAAAQASTSSRAHTTQERRVAKACAVAQRTHSAFARRTCSTLRARLARAKRRKAKVVVPAAPAPATTVASMDNTPVANVPASATAPAATATTATAPVPPATTTTTGPARLYGASSPFNTRIPATPRIADNSAAMVGKSLLPYLGSANFANSDDWGISIVSARAADPLRNVGVFSWGYGADLAQPAVHIPDGAKPTLGSDHHLVVLDGDREMDMWVAEQQGDGSWLAGARAATSASGSGIAGPVSGNAAGFALAAGVIRPEEIKAGRIDHALVFTSPYVRNTFVAPAVHGDGRQSDPDAMPMGTHIQLDPAADISRLPRPQQIMAQALKDYGAYLVDSSGSLAVRGEASIGRASTGGPSDIWSPVGVTDASLRTIPWDQMRVIAP